MRKQIEAILIISFLTVMMAHLLLGVSFGTSFLIAAMAAGIIRLTALIDE